MALPQRRVRTEDDEPDRCGGDEYDDGYADQEHQAPARRGGGFGRAGFGPAVLWTTLDVAHGCGSARSVTLDLWTYRRTRSSRHFPRPPCRYNVRGAARPPRRPRRLHGAAVHAT